MKYAIISNSEPDEVAKEVNRYLGDGWELHGHLSVIPFDVPSDKGTRYHYSVYTQAMVKNDEYDVSFEQDVA
jgi:hypothetical protein